MAKWSEPKIKALRERGFPIPSIQPMPVPSGARRSNILTGYMGNIIIMDECYHSPSRVYDYDAFHMKNTEAHDPKSNYWTQPIPSKDKPVSSPSEAKRAKLRAKRKKKC